MTAHPHNDDDLELYALGALDAEERRALEAHLGECPECQTRLQEVQGRVHLPALAAPPRVPSPEAKEKLLRRIGAEARARLDAPGGERRRGWLWGRTATAWALATLVLAISATLLVRENRRMQRELRAVEAAYSNEQASAAHARAMLDLLTATDTMRVALVSAAERPVAHGRVFYNPKCGLVFYAAYLPSLPADRTYQLWLIPMEGKPVSAGIFAPDEKGEAELMMPPIPLGLTAKAFAVTVEPAGGMPQPTGPKVLLSAGS